MDASDTDALLNNVKVKAIANIGDTVSIFSTQEAADRAVKEDKLDPNLVAVIPPDSAGNIYVIDGDKNVPGETGTVHHIGGDTTVGDGTYYSYTVKDGDGQNMTVPVRLAYKAVVTPVDSKTKQPIAGLDPVTVVAVAGKPSLVQIPGYTTTKVTLAAPVEGEKVAHDNLIINQGATGTETATTTDQSNPIGHYYTGESKTVDGHEVVTKATVGTGQSVSDDLNNGKLNDKDGNPVVSGQKADDGTGLKTITNNDYYWSSVGNATATDSTDETKPKDSGSILVPTTSTLDYWKGVAAANQTKADTYKQQSQAMHDKFVSITGLTQKQKDDADALLQSVVDIYANVSQKNGDAKAAFEGAETATDDANIYNGGQNGYASLREVQNLLVSFKADLGALTTKNDDVKSSLATFKSSTQIYGDTVKFPDVNFGSGYGTITDDQLKEFSDPKNYYYYDVDNDPDGKVQILKPKNQGHYMLKLTDAGREFLKSLAPDNPQAGLYVSSMLTINPKEIKNVTVGNSSVTYGGDANGNMPAFSGNLGSAAEDYSSDQTNKDDFEVTDSSGAVVGVSQLLAGKTYTISYTKTLQDKLNSDKNYKFDNFGTGTLTVNKRQITVKAQNHSKTYGDSSDPAFDLTSDSAKVLVNGDKISSLNMKFSRTPGENAGTYIISGSGDSSNYIVNVKDGTFTIAQKPVSISISSSTIHYGDSIPAPTFTLDRGSSLVGIDKGRDLKVTITNPEDAKNVGTYDVTGTAAKDGNYDVSISKGTLSIIPKEANPTVEENNITYGDTTLPEIKGSLDTDSDDHKLDQSDFEVVDDSGNLMDLSKDKLQVGKKYWIQYTDKAQADLEADKNYDFKSFGRAALIVNAKEANPTVEENSITYGDETLPEIKGSLDTDSDDHKLDQSDFEVVDDSGNLMDLNKDNLQVGKKYWIQYTDKAKASLKEDKNYDFKLFGKAALTVNAKEANPTVEGNSITYGDKVLPEIKGSLDTVSGDHNLDQSDFEIVDDSGKLMDLNNDKLQVGKKYWIQYTDTAQANLKADKNYDFQSFGRAQLTVNAKYANPTVDSNYITYGDKSLPEIKGSLDTAKVDHQLSQSDFEVVDDSGNLMDLSKDKLQVGKKYWIQYTDKAQAALKADNNYNFVSFGRATLTVKAKDVNSTIESSHITYGDKNLPVIVGNLGSATIDHKLNQSDFEVVDSSGNVLNPEQLQAGGKYWIQYTDKAKAILKADKNYTFNFETAPLVVTPKDVSPQIPKVDVTYGADSLPVINGDLGTEPKDHKLSQSDFEIVDKSDNVVKPDQLQAGGDYTIRYTDEAKKALTADTNYKFVSFGEAKLHVKKADATTTKADPTKPTEATYGDTPEITRIAKIGPKSIKLDRDDFNLINPKKGTVESGKFSVGTYSIELTKDAFNRLESKNPNYDFSKLSFGNLKISPLKITVQINNQNMYAGDNEPQDTAKLKEGSQLKDGDSLDKLGIKYENPDVTKVGTYKINAKTTNPNYDVTIEPGTLKVLGKDVDSDGNVTITEKDTKGNVVKVTKQWNDGSNTVYTSDPVHDTKGVDEIDKDGEKSPYQTIDPHSAKIVLPNSDGSATVVTLDDSGQPVFTHYGVDPDHDGVTSADELKNGTDPLVYNSRGGHSQLIDDATVVQKNQNVATTTSTVALYNKEGKQINDRVLGIDSCWFSDEEYTIGGVIYYRVATDEFAKASDVYVYVDPEPRFVRVYNDIHGDLVDYQGNELNRELSPSSQWRTDRIAIINGQQYYRVATNEFIPIEQVYPYVNVDAEVTTNFETPIYNERDEKLDVALPANGTYKADKVVTMNGVNYYRVATNQFIPIAAVRNYASVSLNVTTNINTPIYNEQGQFMNVELPAKATYKVDRIVYINGVHYYRVATNMFIRVKGF
ncbi:MBG domain-containing protein [Companilactobacillus zhachilii]|uniref:MBG domain-containing protein n=1 Tax=Companilactobacillus zhachilii TaxID=2304606 RepID=UPI004034CD40